MGQQQILQSGEIDVRIDWIEVGLALVPLVGIAGLLTGCLDLRLNTPCPDPTTAPDAYQTSRYRTGQLKILSASVSHLFYGFLLGTILF